MPLKVRKNKSPPLSCPLMECMQFLGGAWTPNVIWYLRGGPRRFGELKIDIPLISPKMLSQRLKSLEQSGVILREVVPTSPPSAEYSLTALGLQLVPAIEAIVLVGERLKKRRRATSRMLGA